MLPEAGVNQASKEVNRLHSLCVKGFKSLRDVEIQFRQVNVLIGANGAGKSGLVSLFRMLSWMTATPGQLAGHVATLGGASRFLHFGPQRTREIELSLKLETDKGMNDYLARWFYAAGDTLVFADEQFRFVKSDARPPYNWSSTGAGHKESGLLGQKNPTPKAILSLLRRIVVHQFHDTSFHSRLRQFWSISDGARLKEDGANLGAFLFSLRERDPDCYRLITEHIRLVYPSFADFELEPVEFNVRIQWREIGSDYIFDAHQASDGTIRFFALAALLLQPTRQLPSVLIVDEPELGLHPQAISVLADMVRSAAQNCQILLATQSPVLVDQFQPEDMIVVEKHEGSSSFRRLDEHELSAWLDEFEGEPGESISSLWIRNVIGGGPTR